MFYSDRIKNIGDGDRVLEIGPGGTPHPRANVFLEKTWNSDVEWNRQCGGVEPASQGGKTVFYDGGRFPFNDKEFDYVICSHVLEHVEDVPEFVSEINRVARKGYVEFPAIYYEYLYNFNEHTNFMGIQNNVVLYMPKSATGISEFCSVHGLLRASLDAGIDDHIVPLTKYMFVGMEWDGILNVKRAESLDEMCMDWQGVMPRKKNSPYIIRVFKKIIWKLERIVK